MIIYNKPLYLGITMDANSGGWYCPATKQSVAGLTQYYKEMYLDGKVPGMDGDHVCDMDGVLVALDQAKDLVKGKLIATKTLAVISFVALVWAVTNMVGMMFSGEKIWGEVALVVVFMILSTLYGSQARNPILHDAAGHRINLRTGATNFFPKCVLQKNPTWKTDIAPYMPSTTEG